MKTYGPVQVNPAGFLSLLDLKDRGKFPGEVTDTVSPVMDLAEYWLRTKQEPILAGAVVPVSGTSDFLQLFQVPDNEWWYVHYLLGGILTDTSGVIGWLQLQTNVSGGGGSAVYSWPVQEQLAALPASTPMWLSARDFWMPPGSDIVMQGENLTDPGTEFRFNGALVTKLRV